MQRDMQPDMKPDVRSDDGHATEAPPDGVPADAGRPGADSELSTEDLVAAGAAGRDQARGTGAPEQPEATRHLFAPEEVDRFRGHWQAIQANFVDEPRQAVQGADHLVAEVMQSLANTFAEHKRELEGQWQEGSAVETEDLRLALQRYRSFFNQLLNA